MKTLSTLQLATEARKRQAKEARAKQRFQLSWRGGGAEVLTGYTALEQYLDLTIGSIRCYLSRGQGVFSIERPNPLTNEPDILTISKLVEHKPKPRRGRPPKHVDWERLGPEAPGYPTGTIIAESARPMPKDRNRRTSENKIPR